MIGWLFACSAPDPRQVVVVLVDTLRPDHLGLYGYERATSPEIDAWAEDAVVFETARSVAPWTLPSTRALLTGRQPERYEVADSLQATLGRAGWSTAMYAANVYLGSGFGLDAGWGTHRMVSHAPAADQVDAGLAWLAAHSGTDALLLLHLMDPHRPYREEHRARFTTDHVSTSANLALQRIGVDAGWTDAERRTVTDEYDSMIAYTSEQLGRLFSALEEDATVVLVSDHGEELWDHGGYEHGHSLYEELLRVPLVIKAPGLAGRRVAEPVSVLDITPTILEMIGVSGGSFDGRSLAGMVRGAAGPPRTFGFGRTLYGASQWAVVDGPLRYAVGSGRERLHHVADRTEQDVLEGDGERWRGILAEAVGAPVAPGWRIVYQHVSAALTEPLDVDLRVPGGAEAWVRDIATHRRYTTATVDGEHVRVRWAAGARGTYEVFVTPKVAGAAAELRVGSENMPISAGSYPSGGSQVPLARIEVAEGRTVSLKWSLEPRVQHVETAEIDEETRLALESLGYVE